MTSCTVVHHLCVFSTRIASQGAPGEQVGTSGMRSYITLKRHVGQPGMDVCPSTSRDNSALFCVKVYLLFVDLTVLF